jgi:hypothetical protein
MVPPENSIQLNMHFNVKNIEKIVKVRFKKIHFVTVLSMIDAFAKDSHKNLLLNVRLSISPPEIAPKILCRLS